VRHAGSFNRGRVEQVAPAVRQCCVELFVEPRFSCVGYRTWSVRPEPRQRISGTGAGLVYRPDGSSRPINVGRPRTRPPEPAGHYLPNVRDRGPRLQGRTSRPRDPTGPITSYHHQQCRRAHAPDRAAPALKPGCAAIAPMLPAADLRDHAGDRVPGSFSNAWPEHQNRCSATHLVGGLRAGGAGMSAAQRATAEPASASSARRARGSSRRT